MDELDLTGQCLIAMPGMGDDRFARSVVYITAHDGEGAMGFVLNQPVQEPSYEAILEELELEKELLMLRTLSRQVPVYTGGPVEQGRGFILHTLDFASQNTVKLDDYTGLTATLDALRALASPNAPQKFRLMLGYSGWSSGQLENELAQNGWLTVEATAELLFDTPHERIYDAALSLLGVDSASLSAAAGHA